MILLKIQEGTKIGHHNPLKAFQAKLPEKLFKQAILFINLLINLRQLLLHILEKANEFLNIKKIGNPTAFIIQKSNILFPLIHNLLKEIQSKLPNRLVKPLTRLFTLKTSLNLGKTFRSLNSKNLVKPIILFLSIILVISTISFLSTTVVQGEEENKTGIRNNFFSMNSSTSTPAPKATTNPKTSPYPTQTLTQTPTLPLIPNQIAETVVTISPTPIPPIPSSTPDATAIPEPPTPTFTPFPTPSLTPTPTIITATPTPTPNPTITPWVAPPTNFAPIPKAWSTATNGLPLAIGGVSNNVLDYNVLYNGNPTIRQDPVGSTINYNREVDGPYITIRPGDRIVFSVWMKTSASTLGDNNQYSGARILIDFYGAKGAITGTASPDGSAMWTPWDGWEDSVELNYVHWGTSTWTQKVMSFTVDSGYPAYAGYAGNWNYASGQWVAPIAIIPCLQVWSSTYGTTDGGSAWFAEPILYINP